MHLLVRFRSGFSQKFWPKSDLKQWTGMHRIPAVSCSALRCEPSLKGSDWDCLPPHLLFTIWEGPTGFSLFKLFYGQHPHGLLDVVKEMWGQETMPYSSGTHCTNAGLKVTHDAQSGSICKLHRKLANMRRLYNWSAKPESFNLVIELLYWCKLLGANS